MGHGFDLMFIGKNRNNEWLEGLLWLGCAETHSNFRHQINDEVKGYWWSFFIYVITRHHI